MSLYNMINGFNPACLLIMPMLGRKQEEWPRFRDCFVTDENNIAIYTRVGGGNRGCGYGEEELYKDPNFITTYDDDFDSTYATYEFSVPEKWKGDFDLIVSGEISEVSDEYVSYLKEFYPTLAEKGVIDKVFRPSSAEEMEMLDGDGMKTFKELFDTDGQYITDNRYQEILRLDAMLTERHIPHIFQKFMDGWQVIYPQDGEKRVMDAIEHYGSYGNEQDKLEIMGLLTPEEKKNDSVLGYLSAEEVFSRIDRHWKEAQQ